MWRVPETPVYHRSNCANPCYDKGGTVRTTFILVNKKSQLSLQGILGLRGAYLLIHLLSGPYCTSLVVAGACTVAMMKNLSLGDYPQLSNGRKLIRTEVTEQKQNRSGSDEEERAPSLQQE